MTILGIETSCDDTGIAVIEGKGKTFPRFCILSNIVASQIEVHKKYGGVYPRLAKREHQKNLPVVLKKALRKASLNSVQVFHIDAVAVTYGPGLSPCLWAGINFAKELAKKLDVPIIPVDHMEGHLLVGLFAQTNKNNQETRNKLQTNHKFQITNSKRVFPAVVLLVSGGHTQLLLMQGIGRYKLLGETRDDAAGEAFDKTARILGLSFPGGPKIAKQAAAAYKIQDTKYKIHLPRPMLHAKNLDFSFSGLKTAVLYDSQKRTKKVRESAAYVRAMAKEIQQAIVDVLAAKTLKAAAQQEARSIILGGGVSANSELRKQLKRKVKEEKFKVQLFFPAPQLATDNGIMPCLAGYFALQSGNYLKDPRPIEAHPNLKLCSNSNAT
ncbi:MAG: tRNA (adenosine(37)-N6)-threonylcarbamoyltransferase complex transferase subunit TsaD [Candidatus Wildermuthbacteria bacterium RIFCSPHIGHO2_02_FULL_49_9]|uniref:tRNA N6-adenosine threonylcarbamoyltransferase n=2 Tax=Candidatus Wildermuthiibacteriota TaxID=1817923 RepID=A0A1G2R1K4_9BACT|nr:MAG: tRNA (adenosine(37)-N6)-threonylcarbamoyltransferase complex transferase subunit TsaD [Candidatus Wildermuthbacteria bacterium RIFCSPHIGHO2_01_FULL_49_22b]OHA71142.1 MAG: tRNA (adenosine(37)-N6)-threonylcarbamoyltransferase complex transferase subunit TsaD [Candidatus Wildermuthbacteria bacterium RIFCSPHIGHO2_02_FULL_49_9]